MACSKPAEHSAVTLSRSQNVVPNPTLRQCGILNCKVCTYKFDQVERAPKILPCYHTFCQACLIQCIEKCPGTENTPRVQNPKTDSLRCPFCRKEYNFDEHQVRELPNNYTLVEMMDLGPGNLCGQHPDQTLKFFCKSCEVTVCNDCTVVSHRDKESMRHEIVEISDALKELTPNFTIARDGIERVRSTLETRKASNGIHMMTLGRYQEAAKKKIFDTFTSFKNLLDKRMEQLVAELDDTIEMRICEVSKQNDDVDKSLEKIKGLLKESEDATNRQDVGKLVTLSRDMYKCVDSSKNTGVIDDVCSYDYMRVGEGHFREYVRGLGKIQETPLLNDLPKHQEDN